MERMVFFMNDMIVKSVDLMGDTIMAAQDKDGNIWAGVSYFCNALGMNKKQKDWQTEKVQSDKILSKGAGKFGAGVFDPNNDTIALRIDFVPLWLTKISVTKQMEKNHPELADKLLEYQLKAKDILAAAFLPKQENAGDVQRQIKLLAQGTTELYERVDELEQETYYNKEEIQSVKDDLEKFKADVPAFNMDTKDIQNALRKKAIEVLGGKDSNAYHDKSVHGYAFADIQIELRRQFGVKRYDQIKHKDVPVALKVVEEYKPPIHIRDKIYMANAQQSLDLEGGRAV